MIAHRRTWQYRLPGEEFAHSITFDLPLTATKVREILRRMFGTPQIEIWAR